MSCPFLICRWCNNKSTNNGASRSGQLQGGSNAPAVAGIALAGLAVAAATVAAKEGTKREADVLAQCTERYRDVGLASTATTLGLAQCFAATTFWLAGSR